MNSVPSVPSAMSAMSAMEAIAQRRAVRSFLPEQVGRECIMALLHAAVWAPTAMHEEPWAFAVVQDPAMLKRISQRAKALLSEDALHGRHLAPEALKRFTDPAFDIFYDAGTLIAIYCRPLGPYAAGDCWLAAENLMLAACAMGLGTCVIGLSLPALNDPLIKKELAIPPELTAIAPIIVGVPRGQVQPSQRKEPQIIAWR